MVDAPPSAAPVPPAAPSAVPAAHRLVLRRRFEEGRRTYGDLGLPYEVFAERAMESVLRRVTPSEAEPPPEVVEAQIARGGYSDLYLSLACERGDARAWAAFAGAFAPRLAGLARSRGISPADAESIAADLLGDLSLPPVRGAAKMLIGTFDATGSLWGWLAVILVRRIGQAVRARGGRAEEGLLDEEAEAAPTGRVAADPAESAADAEAAEALGQAVEEALDRTTERERLALLWKYRDGLAQREIAALLGVGEPRVSRLIDQSLAKITASVKARLGSLTLPGGRSGEAAWRALRDSLALRMARFPAAEPHPRREGTRPGRPNAKR
jgi:RNA polymerase sigma factor (sigma-70 family)